MYVAKLSKRFMVCIKKLIVFNTLKQVKERVKNESFSSNMLANWIVYIKCRDESIIFRV